LVLVVVGAGGVGEDADAGGVLVEGGLEGVWDDVRRD
jgi:hypothetical protein